MKYLPIRTASAMTSPIPSMVKSSSLARPLMACQSFLQCFAISIALARPKLGMPSEYRNISRLEKAGV